jgi:septum formation protein
MLIYRALGTLSRHHTALPLLKPINEGARLVLASKSPRRRELLQLMGFDRFEVLGSAFAEDLDKSLFANPAEYTVANAAHKAEDVIESLKPDGTGKPEIVIGADTMCVYPSAANGLPWGSQL